MISWKKQATAGRGTEGSFVVNVAPKGDGRWSPEVFAAEANRLPAIGIGRSLASVGVGRSRRPASNSLGAAENATAPLVKRAGRV